MMQFLAILARSSRDDNNAKLLTLVYFIYVSFGVFWTSPVRSVVDRFVYTEKVVGSNPARDNILPAPFVFLMIFLLDEVLSLSTTFASSVDPQRS